MHGKVSGENARTGLLMGFVVEFNWSPCAVDRGNTNVGQFVAVGDQMDNGDDAIHVYEDLFDNSSSHYQYNIS